jgi:co-chaperonin GroES (HSP10)
METKDKRRFSGNGERVVAVAPPKRYVIEPLGKWVVIRKIEIQELETEGGVVLPGGGRSQRGEVVAVPDGVNLAPGDIVIYTNFPMDIPDVEDMTGEKNLHLVLEEEIYARAIPCP